MTEYEKLLEIKNKAEDDGRLGLITVEEAQKIVSETEKAMNELTIE